MPKILAASALAVAVLSSPAARAQGSADVARAESLFDAAKALVESGQYADACGKFAESKRLASGLGVTLYLADCYEHVGRTASAWTEFRSAEGMARQRGDKRADLARSRAQALEGKLDRLTIVVAPTVPRADLQVLRDGLVVPVEEWGAAVPVDPGEHVVAYSAAGHPQRTIAVQVTGEGVNASARIERLEDAPAPAPVAAAPVLAAPASSPSSEAPAGEGAAERDPGAVRRWIGVGVGAAGVAGIAVGAVFGLMAKSKFGQSNDGPCDGSDHCNAAGLSLRHDAKGAAGISTVAFIAGGVALAGGVVLVVTAPRGPTVAAIAPWATPGGGGVLVTGSF